MDQNQLPEEMKEETQEEKQDETQEEVQDEKQENEGEKILSPKELKQAEKEAKRAAHPGRYIALDWGITIGIALAVVLFINFVIIVNSTVPTGSMETTIMSHSRMLGFRVAYWFSEPKRGDVIVFRFPDDPSELFVKRIIGLPGETVEIIDGKTYINGNLLEEDYINDDYRLMDLTYEDYGPYEVPENSYFMMGDNRGNSRDSRVWNNTFVKRDAIIGKAWLCYWPFSEFGEIR